MPFKFSFRRIQSAVGFLCIALAWLFPYYGGGSPDAMQQFFMLGMFSGAALLIGIGSISPWVLGGVLCGSLLMAVTPNPYWGRSVAGVAGLLLLGLACQVGQHLRDTPDRLTGLLYAVTAAAFFNAVQGLLQWSDLLGELYRWVVVPERRGTAYGAFRQPNLFATFLCVGSICAAWLVHLRKLTESMAWLLLLVLMFGVAASGSRTGSVEVLALAVFALYFKKCHSPQVTRLLVGQAGLMAVAMVALPLLAGFLGFEFASSASRGVASGQSARLAIWHDALELIAQRPWLGWGWRELGFAHYVTLFEHRHTEIVDNLHNLPLQLAAEFGLPMAAVFFVSLARATYFAFPSREGVISADGANGHAPAPMFAWAILIIIVGVHSMLEYPLWYSGFLFLTGLMLGYLSADSTIPEVRSAYAIASYRVGSVIAVALLALSLAGWMQYAQTQALYNLPFTNDKFVREAAVNSALAQASTAWLFQEQVDLATLGAMAVTRDNSVVVRALSEKLLHSTAEPQVIQPLLLSLWYLNDTQALQFHMERFCHAFPLPFLRWYRWPANNSIVSATGFRAEGCSRLDVQKAP